MSSLPDVFRFNVSPSGIIGSVSDEASVARQQVEPRAKSKQEERSQPSSAMDRALILFGYPSLEALKAAPGKTLRLFELAEAVASQQPVQNIGEFENAVVRLAKAGFVEIHRGQSPNFEVRLTV